MKITFDMSSHQTWPWKVGITKALDIETAKQAQRHLFGSSLLPGIGKKGLHTKAGRKGQKEVYDFIAKRQLCFYHVKSLLSDKNKGQNRACKSERLWKNQGKSIVPKMLKLASSGMAHALTKLYNDSIQKGEWPEAWKKASGSVGKKGWSTGWKKPSPHHPALYSRQSLWVTVEWTGTVNWHFNTVLDTSLYYSLCWILAYQFIEKNRSCEATFIDGCRFQAICRSTFKLNAYGFSEGPLKLIRSYFTSRKNRVKLDSVVSDWKEGSSFGPLLWNIF